MNEVSSTAVRIGPLFPFTNLLYLQSTGEQLESVHIERQRAQAAYDIIDFYNQFSKGDTQRLDEMRKEGRAGRRQVAVLLRRLNMVAKEVDLPNGDKVRAYLALSLQGNLNGNRHVKLSRSIARNSRRRC